MLNASEIVVTLLDIEAIKKELNKQLPPPAGTEYIIDTVALFDDNVLISPDAVYYYMCPRVHNGKVVNMWDVGVRNKQKTAQGANYSLIEAFYFTITPEQLPKYYKDVVNLKTFMGSRYDYNPRITKNTKEFLQAVETDRQFKKDKSAFLKTE